MAKCRMTRKFVNLFLFCQILSHPAMVLADIYGYAAEDGAIYLTDNPQEEGYELLAVSPVEPALPVATNHKPGNSVVKVTEPIATDSAPVAGNFYHSLIKTASENNGIESALLHAVITAESNYNPKAISPKGAVGLMQLMPATARRYGVSNLYDPAQNVQGGARYLSYLLGLFKNDLRLAIAAYNAGENAVIRHGNKVPPFPETIQYVVKVTELYRKYGKSGLTRRS